jgi:hypothetical protein
MRGRALFQWINPVLAALIAAGYVVWWWIAHVRRG